MSCSFHFENMYIIYRYILNKKYAVYNTKERFRKYIPCVSDAIISSDTIPLDTVQYFKLSHDKK